MFVWQGEQQQQHPCFYSYSAFLCFCYKKNTTTYWIVFVFFFYCFPQFCALCDKETTATLKQSSFSTFFPSDLPVFVQYGKQQQEYVTLSTFSPHFCIILCDKEDNNKQFRSTSFLHSCVVRQGGKKATRDTNLSFYLFPHFWVCANENKDRTRIFLPTSFFPHFCVYATTSRQQQEGGGGKGEKNKKFLTSVFVRRRKRHQHDNKKKKEEEEKEERTKE